MNMPRTATASLAASSNPPQPASWKISAGAFMVTAVFVLSNSASPLYPRWQAQFAFSSATLTQIFAVYIVGLLGALLIAGQLSDRLGRKAVLLPGFIIAMMACGFFMTASSVTALLAARFLTGVAVGVIVSAGMAAVVDLGGLERKRQASQAASIAMVVGAGLGPLLAGALAQLADRPIGAIFGVELALLAIAMGVMFAVNLPDAGRTLASKRIQLPAVPAKNRRDLALGVAVFAPGLSATSFILSLGPLLLSDLLHVSSPLLAGGTACFMFMSAAGIQFAFRNRPIRTALLSSAAATLLSMGALIGAIYASAPSLLLAAAALAGMGQGLGQLGGLTALAMNVPDGQRAQANSLLNIGAYIPAGLLPVATGFLVDRFGMAAGTSVFALVISLAALMAAYFIWREQHA